MKIAQVNTYFLQHELSENLGMAQGETRFRNAGLVEIISDSGISGWGEGLNVPTKRIIGEYLIGQDPFQLELIWSRIAKRGWGAISYLSAIDIALHDLIGKELGKPIYDLMHGQNRNRVKAYASGLLKKPQRDGDRYLTDEASSYVDMGFHAVKMKVGFDAKSDIENVRKVRNCVGDSIGLAIDANCGFSVDTAIDLGRQLEDCNLLWFEEPCELDEVEGYRQIRKSLSMPIAGGELLRGRASFAKLIENQMVDIVQPDLSICGGISECKKIATLAESSDTIVIPHMWGGILRLAATLQTIAMLPETEAQDIEVLLEYDMSENPFRTELSHTPLDVRDGFVQIPDAPGLGVELEREKVMRYCSRSNSLSLSGITS